MSKYILISFIQTDYIVKLTFEKSYQNIITLDQNLF